MLWTTTAGMIDFIVFAVVVVFAAICGDSNVRKLALISVFAFVFDRFSLLAFDGSAFVASLVIGTGISTWLALQFCSRTYGGGYAALYVVKLSAINLFGFALLSFDTLAAVLTVVLYLQLIILLGGGINGATGGRLSFGHTSLQNNSSNRRNNSASSMARKGEPR